MIALLAPSFDTNSPVLLPSRSGDNLREMSRRVSRRATLDGSAAAPDYGYCVADRTLTVGVKGMTTAERDGVEWLLKTYARIVVVTDEGIFLCAPASLNKTALTLLAMEQID